MVSGIIGVMKRDMMDILACPVCKGKLKLNVEVANTEEIVAGSLYCPKCEEHYPIVDSIPGLVPTELRL
jgi:uncharacterized protein YbaR (Trm112 family)